MKLCLTLTLGILSFGSLANAAQSVGEANRTTGQSMIDNADRQPVVQPMSTASDIDPFAGKKAERIRSATGELTSKTRSLDPFGVDIRGEFKTSPGGASPASATKNRSSAGAPGVAVAPTFEQAIKNLAIGGINVDTRELILGSRSVREGDIIVLTNGGIRFAAWIEKVAVDGIAFRDRDHGLVVTRLMRSAPRTPASAGGAAPLSLEDYFRENPVNPSPSGGSNLPVTKNTQ